MLPLRLNLTVQPASSDELFGVSWKVSWNHTSRTWFNGWTTVVHVPFRLGVAGNWTPPRGIAQRISIDGVSGKIRSHRYVCRARATAETSDAVRPQYRPG